jgi:hypothetical protein
MRRTPRWAHEFAQPDHRLQRHAFRHSRQEKDMIRDYLRRPNRYGAGRHENPNEPYQERNRQQGNASQRTIDWDRWPDAEALRWSPRSGLRDEGYGASRYESSRGYEEGYGYGDPCFADDQRAGSPRFQEGWEGPYRSAPWTLGAEQVSPGLHGPYGRSTQPQSALDELFGDERGYASPYEGGQGNADERRRRTRGYPGPHRGLGPHGYTRSDERIREDVCERLTDHPAVDARNVEVAVENGVVLLQGTVSERVMKYCAEDCSGRVSGVKDVDNRIHVDRLSRQQT